MKNLKKSIYKALALEAACMFLFLKVNAETPTGIDIKNPGDWIEQNWMFMVILGVLILLILLLSSGKRKITSTTTTIRKDGENTTEITTIKEE